MLFFLGLFFLLQCLAFHFMRLSLLQVSERGYLCFERAHFFQPEKVITQEKILKTSINLGIPKDNPTIFNALNFALI